MKIQKFKSRYKALFMPLLPLFVVTIMALIVFPLYFQSPANTTMEIFGEVAEVLIPMIFIVLILLAITAFTKIDTDYYFLIVPLLLGISTTIFTIYIGLTYYCPSNSTCSISYFSAILFFASMIIGLGSCGIYWVIKKIF